MRVKLYFIDSSLSLYWLWMRIFRNILFRPFICRIVKRIMRYDRLGSSPDGWMTRLRRLHFNLIERLKFSFMFGDRIIFFRTLWKHLVAEGYPIIRSGLIFTSISECNGWSFSTSTLMGGRWWSWDLPGCGTYSVSACALMGYANFGLALWDNTILLLFWNFDGEIEIFGGSIIDGDIMRDDLFTSL